jgi:hypothetical protein
MTRPPTRDKTGGERDAWLLEALRHAPDADHDASPVLSDVILRAARSAVALPAGTDAATSAAACVPAARAVGRWQALISAWRWLARPPVAAGFASVMMVTLVGILWRGQPLDETLTRSPAPVSAAPQERTGTAPVAGAAVRPDESTPSTAVAAPAERGRTRFAAAPEPVARPRKPAEETPAAERPEVRSANSVSAAPAGPSGFAPEPVHEQADSKALRASPAAAADKSEAAPDALRAAPSAMGGLRAKARSTEAESAPLAGLLADIARQPDRWRWQRGGADARAMTPGLQSWLAQVDRAAASRWAPSTERGPGSGQSTLHLLRDGVLRATLGLDGASVWLDATGAAGSASSRAALSPASIEALRSALDEAAP